MTIRAFQLKDTTKENFEEGLERCRHKSCFKDPLGGLCVLHRVHRASSRELTIGGSYPLSPDGQSVRHVKQERMFSFEMTQPTSRLLEVVVHSFAPSVVDERAERIVDARLRALLEEIRLLYGDAYSESPPRVMVGEQAEPQADSGAVVEEELPRMAEKRVREVPPDIVRKTIMAAVGALRKTNNEEDPNHFLALHTITVFDVTLETTADRLGRWLLEELKQGWYPNEFLVEETQARVEVLTLLRPELLAPSDDPQCQQFPLFVIHGITYAFGEGDDDGFQREAVLEERPSSQASDWAHVPETGKRYLAGREFSQGHQELFVSDERLMIIVEMRELSSERVQAVGLRDVRYPGLADFLNRLRAEMVMVFKSVAERSSGVRAMPTIDLGKESKLFVERLIEGADIPPMEAESLPCVETGEQAEPQAGSDVVAEQPPPAEDEMGKKRGPTARTQMRTEVFKHTHPKWTPEKLATLFISYSRKDSEFAHRLAGDLRTARYSVWVDVSGLRGGQEWAREIDKAVRGCDTFILIISPDSMASRWVSKETLLAMDLEKPVVPVMWREAERPMHLVDIQYVEFRGAYNDAMQELYEALPPATFLLNSNPPPPSLTPNLPKSNRCPSSC